MRLWGNARLPDEGIEHETRRQCAVADVAVQHNPANRDAEDIHGIHGRVGQSRQRPDEIDHKADDGRVGAWGCLYEPNATDLDQAAKGGVTASDDASVIGGEPDTVVPNQRAVATLLPRPVEESEGQGRFACAGLAPDEDSRLSEDEAGGVDGEGW